jgi:hypothetical protein
MAAVIGCLIVLFSLLTFVSNSISNKIKTDMETANLLAAKLKLQLGPSPDDDRHPGSVTARADSIENLPQEQIWFGPKGAPADISVRDVITDLQQFAALSREIEGYAQDLNLFLLGAEDDPYALGSTNRAFKRSRLELDPNLNIRLSHEFSRKLKGYQEVRAFANCVRETVSVWYGGIATCVLPVLSYMRC